MTLKVASIHGTLEPKLMEIWKNYWHVSDTKIIQTTQKSSYFAFITWWGEIKHPLEQKSKNIFLYVCYENETNYVKKYDVWRIWRTFSHVHTTFSHENIESRKKSWKVCWDSLEEFQISRNQIQKGAKWKMFLLIWSVNCKYFCDSASYDNESWCVR